MSKELWVYRRSFSLFSLFSFLSFLWFPFSLVLIVLRFGLRVSLRFFVYFLLVLVYRPYIRPLFSF